MSTVISGSISVCCAAGGSKSGTGSKVGATHGRRVGEKRGRVCEWTSRSALSFLDAEFSTVSVWGVSTGDDGTIGEISGGVKNRYRFPPTSMDATQIPMTKGKNRLMAMLHFEPVQLVRPLR